MIRTTCVALLVFVLSASLALAVKGPCSVSAAGSTSSTIACTFTGCTGTRITFPQQSSCALMISPGCTDGPNDLKITYPAMVLANGTACGFWPAQWSCAADSAAAVRVPGGADCT